MDILIKASNGVLILETTTYYILPLTFEHEEDARKLVSDKLSSKQVIETEN
jgi:hypothetical protein